MSLVLKMVALVAAFLILLCLCAPYLMGQAYAHEWFTGKRNPATNENCCNHIDCAEIEEGTWWSADGQYFVVWKDGRTYSIPVGQAQPSQSREGKAAACVLAGRMRCFFAPLSY